MRLVVGILASLALLTFCPAAVFAEETSASLPRGTLIKGESSSAVYFYGWDERRYVFPNEKVYFTWYEDFSGVQRISDDVLASITIGGNVTYRPGVKMIKLQTDPRVYAVGNDQLLRWVTSEVLAREIYGSDWADQIDDVSDAFFVDYEVGRPIKRPNEYNPDWQLYTNADLFFALAGGYTDASDLPEDVPLYPNGNVESVAFENAGVASVSFRSNDAKDGVFSWYREHAYEYGWVEVEPSAVEKFVLKEALGPTFQQSFQGTVYKLSITVYGSSFYVQRSLNVDAVDIESLPDSVPVYTGGELVSAGPMGKDTYGYLSISEESPPSIFNQIDPDARKQSWQQIEVADVDANVVRAYERMQGPELRHLYLFIIDVPEEAIRFVMVSEGPSTMFGGASLSEVAEGLY